jgi:hypothetical protein
VFSIFAGFCQQSQGKGSTATGNPCSHCPAVQDNAKPAAPCSACSAVQLQGSRPLDSAQQRPIVGFGPARTAVEAPEAVPFPCEVMWVPSAGGVEVQGRTAGSSSRNRTLTRGGVAEAAELEWCCKAIGRHRRHHYRRLCLVRGPATNQTKLPSTALDPRVSISSVPKRRDEKTIIFEWQ